MRKHILSIGIFGLALGVMVMGASVVTAKGGHGGGGHSGGHSGGGHGGGHSGGGYHHGGYGGGYHGGGNYGGGYGGGYYGHNHGYYPYSYYGYPGFYFGNGGYPYYYGGGYDGYGYDTYDSDPSMYSTAPTYYPQQSPQDDSVALTEADALFHVLVPPAAAIWVNGDKTTQTGPQREFITNGLTPGRAYTYEIRARWTQNGQEVDRTQKVKVQGGERRVVNFLAIQQE